MFMLCLVYDLCNRVFKPRCCSLLLLYSTLFQSGIKDQKLVPLLSTSCRGVIHPGGWTCYHTCILTFKKPGLHRCLGFNSESELHIAMQQGWLSAFLLTCTTLGCTHDRSPQWTVTLGKDNTRLYAFPFSCRLRHAGSQYRYSQFCLCYRARCSLC